VLFLALVIHISWERGLISLQAREADSARAEVDALKTKMKRYADYDEVKRELEILKVRLPSMYYSQCVTSVVVR
jgi:hypothetical protein